MTALASSSIPSLPSLSRAFALSWPRVAAYSGSFSLHVILALMLLVPPLAMQMRRVVEDKPFDGRFIPIVDVKPEPPMPRPPVNIKKVVPATPKPQITITAPVPTPLPPQPTAPANTIAPPSDTLTSPAASDSGAADVPPSAMGYGTQTKIPYPQIALRNRVEGKVILRVLVGTDGGVEQIEIEHSSGSRDLDRAAREAVMKWKFKPGLRGGAAYSGWALVPISFTLPQ